MPFFNEQKSSEMVLSSIDEISRKNTHEHEDDKLIQELVSIYYPNEKQKTSESAKNQFMIEEDQMKFNPQNSLADSNQKLSNNFSKISNTYDNSGFVVNIKKPRQHSRSLQSLPLLRSSLNKNKSSKSSKFQSQRLKSTKISPEQILQGRYNNKKGTILAEISQVKERCSKFGGYDFINKEINRQTIDLPQARQFYIKRIKSVYGSLSLPKIEKVRGIKELDLKDLKIKQQQKMKKSPSSKPPQNYNKWFIKPQQRFKKASQNLEFNINKTNEYQQKYLQKMIGKHEQKMAELKHQFKIGLSLKAANPIFQLSRQPSIRRNNPQVQ